MPAAVEYEFSTRAQIGRAKTCQNCLGVQGRKTCLDRGPDTTGLLASRVHSVAQQSSGHAENPLAQVSNHCRGQVSTSCSRFCQLLHGVWK